jgi:aryl-alcohol dehydrogenase-like predicted oxidoreductase
MTNYALRKDIPMFTRTLGRSAIEVSALGLGCWAIGGPFYRNGNPVGWGEVDDAESLRALERALDLGVTFFDTSDVYGCGHSERILGQALQGRRQQVVIATKFGNIFDAESRTITGASGEPAHIRRACTESLARLQTDYIDLYQFHVGDYDLAKADDVRATLEDLVAEGKIRSYGWSTDSPERAAHFAEGPHCSAIQQRLNLFEGNQEVLTICERQNLASVNRGPLAMGLLTGKFDKSSQMPANDVRHAWDFQQGEQARRLEKLAQIRDVLTSDGRTLAQAALGWIWAHSPVAVPIPGFKTVAQVEENAGALERGPLGEAQMAEVNRLLTEED